MYLQALNDGFVVLEPGVEFLSVDNLPKLVRQNVLKGDKMYLKALNSGLIVLDPGVEFLSIANLPTVVSVLCSKNELSYEVCQFVKSPVQGKTTSPVMVTPNSENSDLPVIESSEEQKNIDMSIKVQNNIDLLVEAQNINIDLPIVVDPVEAQNNIDLPIAVEPVEAQHNIDLPTLAEAVKAQSNTDLPFEAQNNNGLPIVGQPFEEQNNDNLSIFVEPNEVENENQVWFIKYRKELQGLVITDREIDSHYYDIHTALLNTFLKNSCAILILEGYMMALIKQMNTFFLFDSHARDSNGMPDPNGTAVVMKFNDILDLEQHFYFLSMELHTNLFEIVPVQLITSETNSERKARLSKAKQSKKQKHSEENDNNRQIRLQ
jgi:hypothetical protein